MPPRLHILPFIIGLVLSIACGAGSALKSIAGLPPTPSTSDVSTGSSPMSGDWNADTDFGHLAFTVDPEGQNVTTVVVKMNNFTCSGTSLTTETQDLNSWPIDNGQFSDSVNLGQGDEVLHMGIGAIYNPSSRTFSGAWDFDAYGGHCTGKWTTSPHQ